jgi:uncharacterized protein (TIGR03086 family)
VSSPTNDSITLLSRALDQAAGLMARVQPDQLSAPTPCTDWDVATLLGHVLSDARNFQLMLAGEHADFSTTPEPATDAWTDTFRSDADELARAWGVAASGGSGPDPDLATAEFAVHSYDLATAIAVPTSTLDNEVAERALAFMRANLTPERRGAAFKPELETDSAGSYERLAAFAGRPAS